MPDCYRVLAYRGTTNLGDAIQAVAMSRLLPGDLIAVNRDRAGESIDPDIPFVVNGYLGDKWVGAGDTNTLFIGAHVGYRFLDYFNWMMRSTRTLGFRDFFTADQFGDRGVSGNMIGCATMLLPRHDGHREGEYSIDCDRGGKQLTQNIPARMTWEDQWKAAIDRIELLKTASLVHTSRLHVALPCLAMGTPVAVYKEDLNKIFQPVRMQLLSTLGMPFDRPVTLSLTQWQFYFREFLSKQLGIIPVDRAPVMPKHRS